jgi:hypothetical protein
LTDRSADAERLSFERLRIESRPRYQDGPEMTDEFLLRLLDEAIADAAGIGDDLRRQLRHCAALETAAKPFIAFAEELSDQARDVDVVISTGGQAFLTYGDFRKMLASAVKEPAGDGA